MLCNFLTVLCSRIIICFASLTIFYWKWQFHRQHRMMQVGPRPDLQANILLRPVSTRQALNRIYLIWICTSFSPPRRKVSGNEEITAGSTPEIQVCFNILCNRIMKISKEMMEDESGLTLITNYNVIQLELLTSEKSLVTNAGFCLLCCFPEWIVHSSFRSCINIWLEKRWIIEVQKHVLVSHLIFMFVKEGSRASFLIKFLAKI